MALAFPPASFAHVSGYGVGLWWSGKKLYVHKIGSGQLLGVVMLILSFNLFLLVWWEERLHTGPIGRRTFEFIWVKEQDLQL